MKDIPGYEMFRQVVPLDKGWSADKKYYVETEQQKLLLRISDISCYAEKKAEFEAVCRVEKTGIPMTRPLDFGVCCGKKKVYSLLTWAEGRCAEEALPALSKQRQYDLGLEAGRYLRKIHSIPAPAGREAWETRFNRKIDRKIEGYQTCGLRFDGDQKLLSYIEENRRFLNGRPQCFQHGDYHVGNMVLSEIGVLSIIDFNRFDYGDPWEEFNRISWCAECSKYFASGRINGYFGKTAPEEFFRLLALYIASNTLSSIYWAIPFGQKEIDTMLCQAAKVMEWFDGMKTTVPAWYLKGRNL